MTTDQQAIRGGIHAILDESWMSGAFKPTIVERIISLVKPYLAAHPAADGEGEPELPHDVAQRSGERG